MKLSGRHAVPVSRERAYALLQDPAVLAKCIPGCQRLDRIGENEFAMRMKVVLASISGLFDGTVRIADPRPPASFRLVVEGAGKIGFMKGEGLLTLAGAAAVPAAGETLAAVIRNARDSMDAAPEATGTDVCFDGEVQVGVTIANVGQRLIDTTARMLIKWFFEKLSGEASTFSHELAGRADG